MTPAELVTAGPDRRNSLETSDTLGLNAERGFKHGSRVDEDGAISRVSNTATAGGLRHTEVSGWPDRVETTRADPRAAAMQFEWKSPTRESDEAPSAVARAAAQLKRVLRSAEFDEAQRLDAARALRDAAVRDKLRAPRRAALALILSDALALTDASDFDSFAEAKHSLNLGWMQLLEPFIPVEQERAILRGLLASGWRLTPNFDRERFAAVDPELREA